MNAAQPIRVDRTEVQQAQYFSREPWALTQLKLVILNESGPSTPSHHQRLAQAIATGELRIDPAQADSKGRSALLAWWGALSGSHLFRTGEVLATCELNDGDLDPVAKALVNLGVDVLAQTPDGVDCLDQAFFMGYTQALDAWLTHPDSRWQQRVFNAYGHRLPWTHAAARLWSVRHNAPPGDKACSENHIRRIIDVLNRHGADWNGLDTKGRTPLFYATNTAVFDALIKAGADPAIRDVKGRQAPIFWAELHTPAVELRELDKRWQQQMKQQMKQRDSAKPETGGALDFFMMMADRPAATLKTMIKTMGVGLDTHVNGRSLIGQAAIVYLNSLGKSGRKRGLAWLEHLASQPDAVQAASFNERTLAWIALASIPSRLTKSRRALAETIILGTAGLDRALEQVLDRTLQTFKQPENPTLAVSAEIDHTLPALDPTAFSTATTKTLEAYIRETHDFSEYKTTRMLTLTLMASMARQVVEHGHIGYQEARLLKVASLHKGLARQTHDGPDVSLAGSAFILTALHLSANLNFHIPELTEVIKFWREHFENSAQQATEQSLRAVYDDPALTAVCQNGVPGAARGLSLIRAELQKQLLERSLQKPSLTAGHLPLKRKARI